jgi:hypothetical protein
VREEGLGYSPGEVASLLRGGLAVFGIYPFLSGTFCYLVSMADEAGEDVWEGDEARVVHEGGTFKGLDMDHLDLLMRRVDKIEDEALRMYLWATDPASFPARLVLERMTNNLLKNGMEPDCCSVWQTIGQLEDDEKEYLELPEAERGIHPREAFRMAKIKCPAGPGGELGNATEDTGYASA